MVIDEDIGKDRVTIIRFGIWDQREIRSDYLWMISVEFGVTVDYIMKGDLPELSVDNELAGLIRRTNRRQRCAVLELARAFPWGEGDA